MFSGSRAVTFRHGIKRSVELDILIEAVGDTAQPDDLGSELISATYQKDPTDPQWKDDAGIKRPAVER